MYCNECRCKRKVELAARRALTAPALSDEEVWQREENRKLANADKAAQKNEWILNNKSFAFFDLETFDLAADFGLVMVGCVKDREGGTKGFVAHGDPDEREALVGIRDTLEEKDYVVTYYGTKFDLPYFNTRLILNGERPLHQIRHIDLYYTARFKLKLNRNRLQSLELALFGTSDKTSIRPGVWRRALQGSQEDLDYILDHCVKDVEILERCFEQLKGFINLGATRIRRFGASY
jgi:uncharacterized protein YprB with RNaseH-like and TPR domain